ncbi:MAG: ATP-dependent helicase [Candidatus Bipolaricaulota bacterium]|nr:ATP-dependent helicase [Candidatus Bipolaricaulota bacterium]
MVDILDGLTDEQREAVTHRGGPLLVLAGVGTGKTTVVTRRIAYLIAEGIVERPSQLLVFTFSHQAAEEMLDRAFEWVRYAALDAWIATYHSVCERILRENAPLAGLPPDFRVLDEWDGRAFLLDHLTELPLRALRTRALRQPLRFLSPVLAFIGRAKDEAITPERYRAWLAGAELPPDEADLHRELSEIYAAYQELLSREGFVDFGDLILRAVELLRSRPGLLSEYHRRFPHVLADEFQDTSRAELELVRLLGAHGNATAVGDDDQAIYGFRGVPWDNLLSFLRAFPEVKVVVLTRNFRSTQGILDAALRLVRENRYRLEALSLRGEVPYSITKELVSPHGQGPPPIHRHFPSVGEEAEFVAHEAKRLHGAGVPYREIAVLYRNRYRPDPYLKALSAEGIPWTLAGRYRAGLFDQEEVKLLLSFLRALADPEDSQSLYHLLGSPIYRMGSEDLARLTAQASRTHRPLRAVLRAALEGKELSEGGRAAARRALDDLAFCEDLARGNPAGRVLYAFLTERTGYLEALVHSGDPEAARALENIAAFFERVVRRFEEVARHDRVPWFVRYVDELRELGWNPMVGEAEPGADAVQVMTFHQAKGMEFGAVFLTGLVEDFFPGRLHRPAFSLPRELRAEDVPEEVAHVEEQRRLFYVGMTRAKRHLYLLSADDYRPPGEEPRRRAAKVSRFVLEALGPGGIAPRGAEAPAFLRIRREGTEPAAVPVGAGSGPLQLSFRQVDDWLTCPLKYRYIHVLRVPIRLHPTVILGNAVHQAIQAYHLAKVQGRTVPLAELHRIFRHAWRSEGFLSAAHEEELLRHGEEALAAFYAFEEASGARPTFVEKFFAFTEGEAKVVGYWDRVDQGEDGAVIVDYKTSEVGEEAADRRAGESLQLAIYALGYERSFGDRPRAVELRFLTPEVVVGQAEPSDRMIRRAREAIGEAAAGIRAGEFGAKPSFTACGPCAYRTICPSALPV